MITERVKLNNETGIHARPAGVIVKTAGKYQSQIIFTYEGKAFKATAIMALLGAEIKGGSLVEISCEGSDEQLAMADFKALFADGFGEA